METADELGHLQKRLRDEGDRTASFFAGLSPDDWSRPVYAAGPAWKVRHVLAHFVSAERAYLRYMRDSVGGGPGVPRDFDIDAFNAVQVDSLSGLTEAELLDAFRAVRNETIDFVGSLRSEDLDRIGYHPWFGEESLRFLLRLIYRHPMLHLRDVRLAMERRLPVLDGEGYSRFAHDSGPGAASMTGRRQALAEYMRQSHALSWPKLTALQADDLPLQVFGDGDALWSIGDLVGHLADAEPGMLGQVRRLLAGQPAVPDDFDLNRWNRSAVRRSKGKALPDLLNSILTAHQDALATLETIEETSLDLTGRHGSGVVLTVEGFFRRMVDHRREHTDDIQRALRERRGLR